MCKFFHRWTTPELIRTKYYQNYMWRTPIGITSIDVSEKVCIRCGKSKTLHKSSDEGAWWCIVIAISAAIVLFALAIIFGTVE